MHETPPDIHEHVRIFKVLPRFQTRVNALELDSATMERRLLTADPALSRIIERHAEASLGPVAPASSELKERVRRVLVKGVAAGRCSIKTVAPELGLSERTLQRRLEEEGLRLARSLTAYGAISACATWRMGS